MKAKLFMLLAFSILTGVLCVSAQTNNNPQLARSSVNKTSNSGSVHVNTGKAKPEMKRMAVANVNGGSPAEKSKPDSQPKLARSASKTEEPETK